MNILILNNHREQNELLYRLFQSVEHTGSIDTATSSSQAIQLVQNHPPNFYELFLVDIDSADDENSSLIQHIRKTDKFPAIVLFTDQEKEAAEAAVKRYNACAYDRKALKKDFAFPKRLMKIASDHHNLKHVHLEKIRVLCAEPVEADIELISKHVDNFAPHIHIDFVKSGSAVLKALTGITTQDKYDVIVLDGKLPDFPVLDLLKELINNLHVHQPIVLLTQYGDEELVTTSIKLGVESYIVKQIGYFQYLPSLIEAVRVKMGLTHDLRKSEERFRLLAENARDVVFRLRISPDFGFDYISAAVIRFTDHSPDEFYDKPDLLAEILHPEDRKKFEKMISRPESFNIPIRLRWITRDGEVHWMEVKGTYVKDGEGKLLAFEGIARDITERVTAEEALKLQSRKREELEEIINKSPNIVVRWTPQFNKPVLYISSNIERFGYTADEFVTGKIMYDQIVHPDDRAQLEKDVTQAAVDERDQYDLSYRVVTRSGETHWLEDHTWVVRDENGNPLYHQGIITDVTSRHLAEEAQRKSEELYRRMVETANEGIWMLDGQLNTRVVNKRMADILGYTQLEMLGTPIDSYIFEDDLADHHKKMEARKMGYGQQYERCFRSKNGNPIWLIVSAQSLKNEKGEFYGSFAMLTDITERKLSEERIRKSETALLEAQSVAHLGSWEYDVPNKKLIWSEENYRIFDRLPSKGEPTWEDHKRLTFPEDWEIVDRAVKNAIDNGKEYSIEFRINHPKRGLLWVWSMGRAHRDPTGKITRLTGTVQDITERKLAQEMMERERNLYFVGPVIACTWLLDHKRQLEYISPNISFFGYQSEDLVRGQPHFKDIIHPEDVTRVTDELNTFSKEDRSFYEQEYRIVSPSGQIFWLHDYTIVNRNEKGEAVSFNGYLSNITDKKETEKALQEAESKYRQLVEQIPAAIYMDAVDKTSTTLYISPQIEQLTGYSAQEWQDRPDLWLKIMHPDDRPSAKTLNEKSNITHEPFNMEYRVFHKNGQMVWLQDEARFVKKGYLGNDCWQGVLTNITNRKLAEEEKFNSEQKFRTIIEQSVEGFVLIDGLGRIVEWNPAMEAISGLNKSNMVGKFLWDVLFGILPTERRTSQHLAVNKARMQEALLGQNVSMYNKPMELSIQKPDGERRFIQQIIFPINIKGGRFLGSISQDITERKHIEEDMLVSEARYRSLVENQTAIITRTDREGKFTFVNNEFCRVFGKKREELLGSYLPNRVPEEDRERVAKIIADTMKPPYRTSCENRDITAQGIRWFHWDNAAILDEKGNVTELQEVGWDITERKYAEEARLASEHRYRRLFEDSPISLWEEDYSAQKQYLDALKVRGVKDFKQYFDQHPEEILECLNRIRIIDVNRATVNLYGATSKEDILDNLDKVFCKESIPEAVNGIIHVLEGKSEFEGETINRKLTGEKININLHWSVAPGFEQNYGKVIVSITDITERKRAEAAIRRRDAILEAVSFTANLLLKSKEWFKSTPAILERLGKASEVDRVYLVRYPKSWRTFPIEELSEILVEWTAPGINRHLQNTNVPELLAERSTFNRWGEKLKKGEIITGRVQTLPSKESKVIRLLETQCIAILPIIMERRIEGLIGFDLVNEDRDWDPAELDAFKTLADAFTSTIQSQKAFQNLAEREIRLSAILNASNDAISVSKGDQGIYSNKAFRKLFGFAVSEDLSSISTSSLIVPQERHRFLTMVNDRESGKSSPTHYEIRALKKNGKEFDLEVHVSRYEIMGEKFTLGVLRDVTEQKQQNQVMKVISSISKALRKAQTHADMFPIILDSLVKVLKAHGGVITLADPHTEEMVVEYAVGEVKESVGFRIWKGRSISGHVKETGKRYISKDALKDPIFVGKKYLRNIKEVACYPLIAQRHVIGTMWIGRGTSFNKLELKVIESVAEIAGNAILRSSLHEETITHLRQSLVQRNIDTAILGSYKMEDNLKIILYNSKKELNADAVSITMINPQTQLLEIKLRSGFRYKSSTSVDINLDEAQSREAFRDGKIHHYDITDRKFIRPEMLKMMQKEGFHTFTVAPMILHGKVIGGFQVFNRKPIQPDRFWFDFIEGLAGQTSVAIDSASLFTNLQESNLQLVRAYDATIAGWSRALDIRDEETEGHTQRVVDMTLQLARMFGLKEHELVHLQRGALLHDIGKLVVPDSILFKPGALTPAEWKVMRSHPIYAYNVLKDIEFLQPAIAIPYCHHERWNGSGYPRRLKGEEIPLVARIFAIVDIWDALRSDRPYRKAWSRAKALDYITSQKGKELDPKVTEAFLKIVNRRQRINP